MHKKVSKYAHIYASNFTKICIKYIIICKYFCSKIKQVSNKNALVVVIYYRKDQQYNTKIVFIEKLN